MQLRNSLLRACRLAWALTALCGAGAIAQTAACPPAPAAPTPESIAKAREAAVDRGLLWRISRDGQSSYLYGTLHVGRLEWVFPGPQLAAALNQVDVLALELDLSDAAVMDKLRKAMAAVPSPELPAAVKARLDKQAQAVCVPSAALGPLHPVMQAITVMLLSARFEQLDPGFSQEAGLIGQARARQMRIESLEEPAMQVSVLIPSEAAKAVKMVDDALAQMEDGSARKLMARMGKAWSESSLAEFASYEQWCNCARTPEEQALLRSLNDERNPHLAERIDALHRGGKRVLAAVGALHMVGPKALPKLLAERGYTVEAVHVK